MFDPGSFRDPAGRIIDREGEILRAIFEPGVADFDAARAAGIFDRVSAAGQLLRMEERDPVMLAGLTPEPSRLVSHPRLDFVSYPYEWTFSALKAAALLHLDLHIALLKDGFTLSDATAYNVQFHGTRPVFIDHLSIVRYTDGMLWAGQRQFGMQFLNPLILWAKRGVAPNPWFRGSGEGLPPEDVARLLSLRDKLSFTVFAHVVAQAYVQRRGIRQGLRKKPRPEHRLPREGLVSILKGLRDYIANLRFPCEKSVWSDYAGCNSYDAAKRTAKHEFVAHMTRTVRPDLVFDLGCNSGDFTQTALDNGARTGVGFDFDFGALEQAFARFDRVGAPVLPLWLDASNPSPSQGWAGAERKSLGDRANAGALLALAVIHHLAIARNVPLDMAVDWLMSLAPTGIIEFPSKDDVMVRELLASRPDIFPDYTEEAFLAHVARRGAIREQRRLGDNGRLLVWYDRG